MKPTRTVYTIADFLGWQRQGALELRPRFQRREVWSTKAKSFLLDTVIKGLPVPLVFLRKRQDLESLSEILEVVDGQQRLRTLFSFVQPESLKDFEPAKDAFSISRAHDKELAGKAFKELPNDVKQDILSYEVSTHVFPPSTGDDTILRIFARLNSTGSKLNAQELRNAEFFGEFKTASFETAFRHVVRWESWGVFADNDFARMNEVEATSDLFVAMMHGIQAKTRGSLDRTYKSFDDEWATRNKIERQFDEVMDQIDTTVGEELRETRFRRPVLFFSLFVAVHHRLFGSPGSTHGNRRKLPTDFRKHLLQLNDRIVAGEISEEVQDAMDRATADKKRREIRHRFLTLELGLEKA